MPNLDPAIVRYLGAGTETATSSDFDRALENRSNAILGRMQPGLVYPAPHQATVSVLGWPDVERSEVASLVSDVRREIHTRFGSQHASACVALSFRVWARICSTEGWPLPSGIRFAEPSEDPHEPQVFRRSKGVLHNSYADVWFVVKADTAEAVDGITESVLSRLSRLGVEGDRCVVVRMESRTNPTIPGGGGGRVLGGRFQENLRNPSSPIEMLEHVLVGDESALSSGGAFVFTQRFVLNWDELHARSGMEVESTIGRRQYTDEFVPSYDNRSHVRASHTYDERGHTIKLLRVGLPFGRRSGGGGTPLIQHSGGATPADEAGIYFIGLARSAARIESVLCSQFGHGESFANDRLLAGIVARSDLGGFFYAPSLAELGAEAFEEDARRRSGRFEDWRRFPGVDWERLNRHYRRRSANGLLFYNHQDHLYTMSTCAVEAERLRPPSTRVLFLLERLYSRWDDTWFRSQKPQELAPLRAQLEAFFTHVANHRERDAILLEAGESPLVNDAAASAAAIVMQGSVLERAGWAQRLLCGLAADSDGVGRRGDGGLDTADIHPLDLLAGSMPAQSLGEGKYVIDYARDDDERFHWFSLGLGPTSGVGHVVPGYGRLLQGGLAAIRTDIDAAEAALRSSEPDQVRRAAPLYQGARIAVRGLAEHLCGLADGAARMRASLVPDGQQIERDNLTRLEARLRWLGEGRAPRDVLEALQLIFSAHVCLHLVGEPVAVGRLDRLLRPFQERTPLSESDLQEVIDCFWLKLGEKVLLNRAFIDDRQQLGNLAMGNRAGPYPKGQSVNQWIQQVTVGGRNADGTWEYSDVTVACVRAAARLPFNAPVLSLRVSRDMPPGTRAELLREAAIAISSGGACPILLNDDKIVPGLAASGTGIGPTQGEVGADCWRSDVREEDAYDYACDGCYEPQFVGANWFTLGGIVLLQVLEYALNEGRQILSAGPVDLRGKTMSFRSPPAHAISTYEEVEGLFFKHFAWAYARQIEGTFADFGRMAAVCPAPLLNLFISDCLEKGRDLYEGGARYNVLGPCFTSLANTINALWAIRTMCFETSTAVTTLAELTEALLTNWGEKLIDPLVHPVELAGDPVRIAAAAERYRHLRGIALSLPRWGRGHEGIDTFGNLIAARVAALAKETVTNPRAGLKTQMSRLALRFGTPTRPFGGFCMQPGVGTFASYVEQGLGCAASADGRLASQPIATDMSPAGVHRTR